MIESKREKFDRIRDTRLPKAIKAISLLKNLGRKADYDYTEAMAREITDELFDAVDEVADALGLPPADDQPRPSDQGENRSSSPGQTTQRAADEGARAGGGPGQALPATGGHAAGRPLDTENDEPVTAPHRSRVRWAHDMLRRGDRKDAEQMLREVIAEWIEDEQP